MKQWLENRQVLAQLAAWHDAGVPCALATVVRVRGSAYRHEGAKLVVNAHGAYVGNVSGGCLEGDVREVAARVIARGTPELREYCGSVDEIAAWDLGVGCEGVVEILVEPVRDARAAERRLVAAEAAHVVVTDLETLGRECLALDEARAQGLAGPDDASRLQDRRFVEVLMPPPRLLVVSAGDDAQHLARMADAVGFRVTVADRRPGLLATLDAPPSVRRVETDAAGLAAAVPLDSDSFAVVMTHSFVDDTDALRALLQTPVRYIGMLGPRQRTQRILGILRGEGPVDAERIYGPVGLDIGTDGAEQVALSVIAELLAVRSGRRPQSLRDRQLAIHDTGDGRRTADGALLAEDRQ